MALTCPYGKHESTVMDIRSPPAWKLNEKANVSLQIAAHLKKTLDMFGTGSPIVLKLPSAMELSYFYHRSILDVLDGLFALKAQHYDYIMNGLDDVIILEDPLARKKSNQIFPAAWQALALERVKPSTLRNL